MDHDGTKRQRDGQMDRGENGCWVCGCKVMDGWTHGRMNDGQLDRQKDEWIDNGYSMYVYESDVNYQYSSPRESSQFQMFREVHGFRLSIHVSGSMSL